MKEQYERVHHERQDLGKVIVIKGIHMYIQEEVKGIVGKDGGLVWVEGRMGCVAKK